MSTYITFIDQKYWIFKIEHWDLCDLNNDDWSLSADVEKDPLSPLLSHPLHPLWCSWAISYLLNKQSLGTCVPSTKPDCVATEMSMGGEWCARKTRSMVRRLHTKSYFAASQPWFPVSPPTCHHDQWYRWRQACLGAQDASRTWHTSDS